MGLGERECVCVCVCEGLTNVRFREAQSAQRDIAKFFQTEEAPSLEDLFSAQLSDSRER